MHKTTKLTLALVAMLALVGIGVPVQAEVDPDCSKDFKIPDEKPAVPRSLDEGDNETGWIEVVGSQSTVRVELLTVGTLEFGVFEDNDPCAAVSSSMSTCEDNEDVTTTNILDPQHVDCVLEPGDTYFFHVLNSDDDDHQYNIWER